MKLYTILEKIINALLKKQNTYYYTSGSATAVSGTTFEVCSLNIPTTGTYLVLGYLDSSVGDSSSILSITPTTTGTQILTGSARSTMASGGGVTGWMMAEITSENQRVYLRSYGYSSVSWTARGKIVAIKLVD